LLLKDLGLTDKFVVQCAGNMGLAQGIENMLAATELLQNKKDIHFLFIGSGAKRQWMDNQIASKHLNNITLLNQRPRADQPNFLNACDVAMASLLTGMTGAGVPSRMYNIMAAGKPIIAVAGDDSELSLVVKEEGIGWVVPPDYPEKLADAIMEAYSNPELIIEMGKRARSVAESKYSSEAIIEQYCNLIKTYH
jgi:colanic acid biosynthesis glycosyl transferase WcaI